MQSRVVKITHPPPPNPKKKTSSTRSKAARNFIYKYIIPLKERKKMQKIERY